MTEIKFGTDGWRGVIADDYTFDNVRRVARAIAAYVRKHEDPSRGVMIGYDTRFGSPRFARLAAEVIRNRHLREACQRLHADARDLLRGQAAAGGRGRDDYLQPQSLQLEWGEVQGEVRGLGDPGDHEAGRGRTGRELCSGRCSSSHRGGRLQAGAHPGDVPVRRPGPDRESEVPVRD